MRNWSKKVSLLSNAKLVKIGVNDEFGHSGPAVDLLKEYGLCADNIVAKARDAVKAK